MADIAACLSTGKDSWETPDALFNTYDSLFHFVLDAAADASNHKCVSWFGPGGVSEDALGADWGPWLRHNDFTVTGITLNRLHNYGLEGYHTRPSRQKKKEGE